MPRLTKTETIAMFFEKSPYQWGLRGDPHLWDEMSEHFAHTPIPESADELVRLIGSAFELLTGYLISEEANFYIERFSHGGMSSGMVSPEFWRDKVIPMMRERFEKLS
jgi:hypothetical protein